MHRILIIDDEERLRQLLARLLTLEGYTVEQAANAKQGLKWAEKERFHVVLCDVRLPDANGIDLIDSIKTVCPTGEIVMMTAFGNIPDGVQAVKKGAFDYLVKGDDNERIYPVVAKAAEKATLQMRIADLEQKVGSKFSFSNIIGTSDAVRQAINLAEKVAPTDATVLLLGETGTGKEVFAEAIHHASARQNKPFVAVNCSTFGRDILESELFGHKAGAFTGATKDKRGLMEEAHEGTLFLDEIGEMPLDLQAKLLRVIETGTFYKVGDSKPQKVNVRIIAATHRDLERLTNPATAEGRPTEGPFREDLYFRLSVFQIKLPALRERTADIPLLAQHFVAIFNRKMNRRIDGFSADFLQKLQNHNWRGNIRELKNVVERAMILSNGSQLTSDDLPLDFQQNHPLSIDAPNAALDLASVEKNHIRRVLAHTKNNKTETARLLGIGLTTLYRKIEEYHIEI